MAKYNRAPVSPVAVQPVKAPVGVIGTKKSGKQAATFEGHEGFERKDKSALFLLAAGSLGGEDKFYESGNESTKRLVELVRKVAAKDPEWIFDFLMWLRSEGNIRTASIVGAVEAADVISKFKMPSGIARKMVSGVLQRADEPGEAMAYWLATRGRNVLMPKPIKRGIADGARRLYNEFSFLKYDSDRSTVRFGDVIEMVRPQPRKTPDSNWQSDLFRYAIEKRHGRDTEPGKSLEMIRAQIVLRRLAEHSPEALLEPEALQAAGMTWEDALSLAGQVKLDKSKVWKAILPSLGIMALIRNMRNLDEAKVSDYDVAKAIARIEDPVQIAKSRQLPFRFYSAYKAVQDISVRWSQALDVALNLSLKNIPSLGGRTLILIDTSQSMSGGRLSGKSAMTYQEVAGLFGIALGLKGEADVYGWADSPFLFPMKGTSVLKNLERYMGMNGCVGYGTNLSAAIRKSYVPGKYARMVVISDMQVQRYAAGTIPTDIPCYFYNLAGYAPAAVETTGRVYELGGLTDHTFKMIPMLEAGESGRWPWEKSPEELLLEKMGRAEEVVQSLLL
ncbi:MAG TPA: TROVE domain-containing protein [Candidatus Paceibacterota bacterium]